MIHIQSRGSLFISNSAWHIHYTIMKMSVNEVSAIFGLARWVNKALRRWMSAGQNCSLPLKPKNTMYNKKNTDSKILNIAHCKICKMWLLAAKYLILVIYNYPTATTSTWYKSTDGPAGRPADNPPHSDGFRDIYQTVPKLTVRENWESRPPICQRFISDPDPDRKWQSGTVAIPSAVTFQYYLLAI